MGQIDVVLEKIDVVLEEIDVDLGEIDVVLEVRYTWELWQNKTTPHIVESVTPVCADESRNVNLEQTAKRTGVNSQHRELCVDKPDSTAVHFQPNRQRH